MIYSWLTSNAECVYSKCEQHTTIAYRLRSTDDIFIINTWPMSTAGFVKDLYSQYHHRYPSCAYGRRIGVNETAMKY